CPRFAAGSPSDRHGHRVQPPGDTPAEGGAPGRVPYHTRPGDVPAAGGRAVRALDRAAGAGRGHARRPGETSHMVSGVRVPFRNPRRDNWSLTRLFLTVFP